MQLMTKKVLVAFLGVLVAFGLVSCKNDTTTTAGVFTGTTPSLSNPDDVFFQSSTYNITYRDIYEEFKINDGINRLLFMVDSVLLADYISSVTSDEIAEKIKYLTYGTSDDTEIADLDPTDKADLEQAYQENMSLLGYLDNQEIYVRMVVAKEKYAAEQMVSEDNSDQTWYVGPSTIAAYYESTYYQDITSIKIRFYGETDAKNVLRDFNLVSLNGALKLYTGTKPLSEVPSSSLNDTNTQTLTNEEIIQYFLRIYNYVYGGFRDEIDVNSTYEELLANSELQLTYDDLFATSSTLTTYMFSTIGSYNQTLDGTSSKLFYSYAPVKYYGSDDTSYYLVLNLDRSVKADVSDFEGDEAALVALIGQDVYDEIKTTMIDNYITQSGFTATRIGELRADNDFVINDYYLAVDYQAIDSTYTLPEEGDESIVASYTGGVITADELFAYAMDVNGALYTLYAAQLAVVMDAYFAQVYCTDTTVACETDITKNTSAKMEDHRSALESLKTSFEASYYVYYYTFDEYIYLAFGAKSEDDLLAKYYVKSTLQPYLVYDEIKKDDWALLTDYLYGLVEDYYNNYFSLNVEHLLIYVDRNEDGAMDDYAKFYASLEDQASYDLLLGSFETAIRDYLGASEDNNFSTLITAYNRASRTDATWGQFKEFGFYIMTEDLSTSASLSYLNTVDQYEQPFVDALVATYQQYNLPANIDKSYIYYDQLVETSYGLHLIFAQKGSDFTKPSAAFTMTYDDEGNPYYTEGVENASDMPSISQLKLYAETRFYEIVYGTDTDVEETYGITIPEIPSSVLNSMEAFFTDLNDSMYIVGFLNIIVSDNLQNGTFVNEISSYCSFTDAELKARLQAISDIYFKQVFAGLDTVNE